MKSSRLAFLGGPWHGTWRDDPTPVPTQVVKVYAEPDTEALCADEQVIKLLGRYRKIGPETSNEKRWEKRLRLPVGKRT